MMVDGQSDGEMMLTDASGSNDQDETTKEKKTLSFLAQQRPRHLTIQSTADETTNTTTIAMK